MIKYLAEDIRSYCNRQLYGSEGDLVTVITSSGNVSIVEDHKGFRFPVAIHKLSDQIKEKTSEPAEKPEAVKPINKPVPARVKRTKAAPKPQNTLF